MVELGKRRFGTVAALSALSALVIQLSACPNPFFDRVKSVVDAAKAPQLTLTVGSTAVAAGGVFDFGTVPAGTTSSKVFTITNSGKSDLDLLGGSNGVSIGGANPDQFSLAAIPSSTIIAAGKSRTFTVAFTPTSGGSKSASVTIGSNDPSAPVYMFVVSGSAAAAAPTFSPSPGTYSVGQSVVLSTTTSGAIILYTTDGSTPQPTSAVYSTPIPVMVDGATVVIKAYAQKSGMANSPVVSGSFTINSGAVSTPNFSPPAGFYMSDQLVTITSDAGATIYYTTDGTTPTTASAVFSAGTPIPVTGDGTNLTIKALATNGAMASSTAQADYHISYPPAPYPGAFPPPSTYNTAQTVTLTPNSPTIVYTVDGSTPATDGSNGTIIAGPVGIPVNVSMTIRVVAYGPNLQNSPVIDFPYTLQPLTPSFSPAGGSYSGDQNVTITSTPPGASIRYTTNGTTPTPAVGTLIVSGGSVLITGNTTLKAIAYQTGWTDSPVRTAAYAIIQPPTFLSPSGRMGWGDSAHISIVTPGTQILYTINGSDPASNGAGGISNGYPIGSGVAIPLPFGTTVMKAIAYKAGFPDTAIVTRTYTMPEFLYALSRIAGTLTVYSLDPDTGVLSAPSTTNYGFPPGGMAIDATGQFLYVTDPSSGVMGYAINPASGSPIFNMTYPALSPGAISIVDNGDVVYVANTSLAAISLFSKDLAGVLSNVGGTGLVVSNADTIATDIYARFLYVASASDAKVDGFVLDPFRLPSGLPLGPYALAEGVRSLLIDPTGSWLYVSNPTGFISGFSIDPGTGALSPIPGSPYITSGLDPDKMAIDPTDSYLYATNPAANGVELFQIFGGSLVSAGFFPTGPQPKSVRVDLSGKFLYVANAGDNTISVFPINTANGQLGLQSTFSTNPAGAPTDILITGTPD